MFAQELVNRSMRIQRRPINHEQVDKIKKYTKALIPRVERQMINKNTMDLVASLAKCGHNNRHVNA